MKLKIISIRRFSFFIGVLVFVIAVVVGLYFKREVIEVVNQVFGKNQNSTLGNILEEDHVEDHRDKDKNYIEALETFRKEFKTELEKLRAEQQKVTTTGLPPSTPEISVGEIEQIIKNMGLDSNGISDELIVKMQNDIKELSKKLSDRNQESSQVDAIAKKVEMLEQTSLSTIPNVVKLYVQGILLDLMKADGTSKIDYALKSNGGEIKDVTYPEDIPSSSSSLFQYFFDTPNKRNKFNNAHLVIDPSITPGNCWSFLGHRANITIKLSCPIIISQISLEHIDRQIALRPHSTPHRFQVYGTKMESDQKNMNQTFLLEGEYRLKGPVIQEFPVTDTSIWDHVTLAILSNHNRDSHERDYTCVYRIRVHSDSGCANISDETVYF